MFFFLLVVSFVDIPVFFASFVTSSFSHTLCLPFAHVINYVKFFFGFLFLYLFFLSLFLIIYCSLMSFVMVSPLIFCTTYFISFCLPMQILTDVKCLIEITFRVRFFIRLLSHSFYRLYIFLLMRLLLLQSFSFSISAFVLFFFLLQNVNKR